MEKSITLNMLIDLPQKILCDAEKIKGKNYLSLLSDKIISEYYYSTLRKDLLNVFVRYNDSKILFSNIADDFNITRSYGINDGIHTNKPDDKVLSFVEQKIKEQKWTVKMYNKIESLTSKLTYQESVYFVKSFLYKEGEEAISEELAISRTYLQKIKKSCLVKMYFEFMLMR